MRTATIFIFLNLCIIVANAQYNKTFGFRPINMANVEIVKSVSPVYIAQQWQFPKQEQIDTVTYGNNLFGANRFKPLHNVKEFEPTSFSTIKILNDGNILVICPSECDYHYAASEILFKAIKIYSPSQVNVYLLENKNGNVIWENSIKAYGIFSISESDNQIYIESQNFTNEGIKGERVHVIDKKNGEVLLENGGITTKLIECQLNQTYIEIIEQGENEMFKYILVKKDETNEIFSKDFTREELLFKPVIIQDKILFMSNNKLNFQDIIKSNKIWTIELDTNVKGNEVLIQSNTIYIPFGNKLCRFDLASGQKLWEFSINIKDYAGLDFVDDNIYLLQVTQKPRELDKKNKKLVTKYLASNKLLKKYKKKPFELIDIEQYDNHTMIISISTNGQKNWEVEVEGIRNSNFFLKENKLYLTTNKYLYAIDIQKGVLLNHTNMHKNNAYVQFIINQVNKKLIVRNDEWIYCFDDQTLDSVYAHHFNLVCPSFSSEQLERDIETGRWFYERNVLRKPANTMYVNKFGFINSYNYHYNNAIRTCGVISNNAHQYASYNRTLDNLSGEVGNAVGKSINMVNFTNSMMHIFAIRIYLAQLDAHPYVVNESLNLMNYDNESQAVRIIKKNINGQKFIAIEILELESGLLKFQILSPFQFKEDIVTMYTNFGYMTPFTGYVHAINIRDLVFRTEIDWKNKQIYHYGTGLDAGSYRYYNPKKPEYIRGKLICLPFDFKVDKKYL